MESQAHDEGFKVEQQTIQLPPLKNWPQVIEKKHRGLFVLVRVELPNGAQIEQATHTIIRARDDAVVRGEKVNRVDVAIMGC